jgi:IPTL-CTERM motif
MRKLALVLILVLSPLLHAAYSTGFEPPTFILGDVNGQDGWGHLDNSPTGGTVVVVPGGSAPSFGTQSLALFTRNDVNFGVANRLFSATTTPAAGETGSTLGGEPAVNPQSHFTASLWYRPPTIPVVSTRPDGRIAELNPSDMGGVIANRYAQVRIYNDAGGRVRVEIGWYTTNTFDFTVAVVAFLDWGQWYRFDYLIHLVDGMNGNAPNDRFTLTIFDEAGTQLGTACGSTWEAAYKTGSFGGGTTPRAINGFDFWSTTGPNGTVVGHLDNLTMDAVTLAPTAVTIDGATNACAAGTTTLTANVTGGTAASYEWRDAGNTVVGTNPTFAAGPGTYTVTVTDTLCVSVTSAPFAVTAFAPLQVAITGPNSVCCGQTVTLTANPTGGSGSITGYEWRSAAADQIIGTGPSFDAPAGTYRVTVIDTCGPATSAPFTVDAEVIIPVPTVGEWGMGIMAVMLCMMALVRMQQLR